MIIHSSTTRDAFQESGLRVAGVVGAGTMGTGIALTILRSGMSAVVVDADSKARDRCRKQVEAFLGKSVSMGKLTAQEASSAIQRLSLSDDIGALSAAGIIVEAVWEELSVKHDLLRRLDEVCPADVLVLTNTSTLSITEIGAGTKYPERVVGAHYCLPAQLMKLVEMSRGLQTSDEYWNRAWQFQIETGQRPVETKDRPGFVLNYFCIPYHNDAIRLVEANVAEPTDIDIAIKASMGFAMGPFELIDMIGLDTQLRASEAFFSVNNDPRTAPPPLLRRMVAAGFLGRKTRRGFYEYQDDAIFGA